VAAGIGGSFCGVGGGEPDPDNAASAADAVWNRAWGVNVMAQVYGARAALPGMIPQALGIKVSVLCPQGVDTAMLRAGGSQEQPQNLDGVLSPDDVAEAVVKGLEAESFLILPHEIVLTYMQRKTADYDRWLGGMRRLRAKVLGRA